MSSRPYTINTAAQGPAVESASTPAGPIEPYVSSYPYLTNKDKATPSDSWKAGEVFVVKYIMKIQPRTRGKYVFKVTPPASAKLCKLELVHIGENMPCTEPPPENTPLTGYENTKRTYADGVAADAHECGKHADYTFTVSDQ